MGIAVKQASLVFFLVTVLLFQTLTFTPFASAQSLPEDVQIPSWLKNNAKWWMEDKISDTEIVNAIENLLDRGIIKLDSSNINSKTASPESSLSQSMNKDDAIIPSYIKDVFVLWEEKKVADAEVVRAIKFLVEENVNITLPIPSQKQPKKLAAIIDQLHDTIPNEYFQKNVQQYLELAGYQVDIYTTKDITVDFYKKLPSLNYKFIVLRTHSGEDLNYENPTYLFTGEKYDSTKYINEQLSKHIGRAVPLTDSQLAEIGGEAELTTDDMYFIVNSKLVDELMVGEFPKSTIVIAGCDVMKNTDLADALISRGASGVIGWESPISNFDNDRVILALLENILVNKMVIRDSISSVMQESASNLIYNAELVYIHR